jgi:hypothetical protein
MTGAPDLDLDTSGALALYDGQDLLGWILKRAEGFEAWPAEGQSLGHFPDKHAAVAALRGVVAASAG